MSRCAFCGDRQALGHHFFAHRCHERRVETVKVCERCEARALDAGYVIAEREPAITVAAPNPFERNPGTTPP